MTAARHRSLSWDGRVGDLRLRCATDVATLVSPPGSNAGIFTRTAPNPVVKTSRLGRSGGGSGHTTSLRCPWRFAVECITSRVYNTYACICAGPVAALHVDVDIYSATVEILTGPSHLVPLSTLLYGKRGTKRVLEYGRLAMGFANVRASRYGIR